MKRLLAAVVLFVSACTAAPAPQTATLPDVALPDLSRVDKSVQDQITASYQVLQSRRNDANAYGELGNLLFAAEFYDAAEAPYLHAQALASDEGRWPYYLGQVYKARNAGEKSIAAFQRAQIGRAHV